MTATIRSPNQQIRYVVVSFFCDTRVAPKAETNGNVSGTIQIRGWIFLCVFCLPKTPHVARRGLSIVVRRFLTPILPFLHMCRRLHPRDHVFEETKTEHGRGERRRCALADTSNGSKKTVSVCGCFAGGCFAAVFIAGDGFHARFAVRGPFDELTLGGRNRWKRKPHPQRRQCDVAAESFGSVLLQKPPGPRFTRSRTQITPGDDCSRLLNLLLNHDMGNLLLAGVGEVGYQTTLAFAGAHLRASSLARNWRLVFVPGTRGGVFKGFGDVGLMPGMLFDTVMRLANTSQQNDFVGHTFHVAAKGNCVTIFANEHVTMTDIALNGKSKGNGCNASSHYAQDDAIEKWLRFRG